MHPEYESYKKMGGLLGLFVGWWVFIDVSAIISITTAWLNHTLNYSLALPSLFLTLQLVMYILLARRCIHFRTVFCASAFIWFWLAFPYPSFWTFIGNSVSPVLSIMYLFCSIRVDVYCGVWKAR